MNETLLIKLLSPNAKMPHKAHRDDACYDVCACLLSDITVAPMATVRVPLGFAMQLPHEFYQAKLLGRSGLNSKGVIVLTGTIDSSYNGELSAVVFNSTSEPFVIEHGMRIAQLDIQRVYDMDLQVVDTLEETKRGANGFGSTGLN